MAYNIREVTRRLYLHTTGYGNNACICKQFGVERSENGNVCINNFQIAVTLKYQDVCRVLLYGSAARVHACVEVGEDVLQCTGLPDLKLGYLNYTDIEYNVCIDRRVDDILNCTEFAADYYHCRLSPQFQILVDTDKLFRLMDYFCARYEIFLKNALCISQQANNVLKCQEETFEYPDTPVTDSIFEWICGWYQHYLSCYTIAMETKCTADAADFVYDFISLSYGTCFPDGPYKLKLATIAMTTDGQTIGLTSTQGSNVTINASNSCCLSQLAKSCMLLILSRLVLCS